MADIMAKTIKFPGLNNTYEFMQPDGTYPDLTAGNIISNDAYNEDTEPYLFRALPYKSKRLEEDLVGATVNWNQLAPAINSENWNENNSSIATVTFSNGVATINVLGNYGGIRNQVGTTAIYQNHKYLMAFDAKVNYDTFIQPFINQSNLSWSPRCLASDGWKSFETIKSAGSTATNRLDVRCISYVDGLVMEIKNVQLIDLTAVFGATIADYVYSLEQATAGSGIAWLKSYGFFTKPYYEYDNGTLKSVNPTAHVTRGVNQWDEITELGGINATTGNNESDATTLRTKNYIPISENEPYYIKIVNWGINTNVRTRFYDADKNYIGYSDRDGNSVIKNRTFYPPKNACYMRWAFVTDYGTTYNHDICLNISNADINGKYFPYEEHTYDLGNVPLYGLFQLENNKLKAYGDVRHAEGGTDRKFALVDLGTLNYSLWNSNEDRDVFAFINAQLDNLKSAATNTEIIEAICPKFIATSYNSTWKIGEMSYVSAPTQRIAFIVPHGQYADASAFKSAMSGVYLLYPLATPATETTTPFEQYQVCETGGTEEYITTNGVPVGHDTKYYTDLAKKIADLPFDMSMIAPVEETYTATRNYAVGDYLIVDNTFYKVTSAIANGGTITPNTNVTATTVATELIALR